MYFSYTIHKCIISNTFIDHQKMYFRLPSPKIDFRLYNLEYVSRFHNLKIYFLIMKFINIVMGHE